MCLWDTEAGREGEEAEKLGGGRERDQTWPPFLLSSHLPQLKVWKLSLRDDVTCLKVTQLISHRSWDQGPDLSDSHECFFPTSVSQCFKIISNHPEWRALGSIYNPAEPFSLHRQVFIIIFQRQSCSGEVDPTGSLPFGGESLMPHLASLVS